MSETRKGRRISPEARAKISLALRGNANSRGSPRPSLAVLLAGNRYAKDAPVIGECAYCGAPAQTHDHVTPKSRGGTDDPGNIVPACWSCNTSKGRKTLEEWVGG